MTSLNSPSFDFRPNPLHFRNMSGNFFNPDELIGFGRNPGTGNSFGKDNFDWDEFERRGLNLGSIMKPAAEFEVRL